MCLVSLLFLFVFTSHFSRGLADGMLQPAVTAPGSGYVSFTALSRVQRLSKKRCLGFVFKTFCLALRNSIKVRNMLSSLPRAKLNHRVTFIVKQPPTTQHICLSKLPQQSRTTSQQVHQLYRDVNTSPVIVNCVQ